MPDSLASCQSTRYNFTGLPKIVLDGRKKRFKNERSAIRDEFYIVNKVDITELAYIEQGEDQASHRTRPALNERDVAGQIALLQSQTLALAQQLEQQRNHSQMLEQKLFIHNKSGLPNHLRLEEDIKSTIGQAQRERKAGGALPAGGAPLDSDDLRHGRKIAVLIIHLDNKYDMVVKTLKTSISEWILYQIGVRLGECVQPDEGLYHTKDDEFVILLANFTNLGHLKTRLAAIHDAVTKPHIFSGHHLYLGCHIGVSLYPNHGLTKSAILHSADIAMGQAVGQRKPWLIFEDAMRHGAMEKMELQSHIIKALEQQSDWNADEQFMLYFQPQVQLGASGRGGCPIRKVDAEVLIRWKHPHKGMIPPDKFIPLAEETGLILPIGNWVLYKALEQLERWEGTAMEKVTLSINISPRQFADPQLLDNVVALVKRKPSLKSRLKLEITESSLMDDPESSIRRLRDLSKLGIRFALDDFGKGYSSLNYLTELPLHTLKLDRAFIANVHRNPSDQAIVRAVVYLTQKLKLKLICEGIETPQQLAALQKQSCRCFQGFLFSKALPVNDFVAFVANSDRHPLLAQRA